MKFYKKDEVEYYEDSHGDKAIVCEKYKCKENYKWFFTKGHIYPVIKHNNGVYLIDNDDDISNAYVGRETLNKLYEYIGNEYYDYLEVYNNKMVKL